MRYINNKKCVNCSRERIRKWSTKNLEKCHERSQKWYQSNFKKVCEKSRKWQQENPEKCYEIHRKWRQSNSEMIQSYTKKYRESTRTSGIKNRARRKNAEGYHSTKQWIDLNECYGHHCLRCKKHESEFPINPITGRCYVMERDHIVPLSVCQWCSKNYKVCCCPNQKLGTNWISNIQPLCHICNGMGGKGTKIIDYRT
jgi:hypothetical protein